ncbi:MAG: helix-turn-helix domain-containing protein [Phycisphaerales bacterium]|nr:helix-turn-helix domain-containing protein [Phycisphaerales bacterium]
MKRLTRNRKLTSAQVRKYARVRVLVEHELPELMARHEERELAREDLQRLFAQLKQARERKGLSLADLTHLTGMDRSALSRLEGGRRVNPTVETLVRYAEAVGKRLIVELADSESE